MAEGFLKIIFIITKMSKYVRKMKLIISGKIRKKTQGESNQGSCSASSDPRALRHTEFSHKEGKIGHHIF